LLRPCCRSYQQGIDSFLPTKQALIRLPNLTGREPSDSKVVELFDQLVLRGHLTPFVPGWWELIRWDKAGSNALTNALDGRLKPQDSPC
jgi:hypothetical protein